MTALALMVAAPAAPGITDDAAGDDEIVVMNEKMRDWRASIVESRGDIRCYTRRSSGDAAIDRIGCASMLQCHARYRDRFATFKDHRIPSKQRSKMRKTFLKEEYSPCVFDTRDAMIAELADQRAAAR